jgi:hypothetical protein
VLKLNRQRRQPSLLPFSEEQIRERAQALWQARSANGKAGTEAGDWEAAKESLLIERSLPMRLRSLWSPTQPTEAQKSALELHKLHLERLKALIAAFGVLATLFAGVGLYLTYQNSQADRQLTTERLLTDRFAKAVEQLGYQDTGVQLGGIYALERISKDSPKDYWSVMEVLTAYVRYHAPIVGHFKIGPEKRKQYLDINVQSALTVIGSRESEHDPMGKRLNLSGSNLSGADLSNADLKGADLYFVILSGADLSDANLRDADLYRADFRGSQGISLNQIKAAKYWQQAHYDLAFRQQLGLPPEKP